MALCSLGLVSGDATLAGAALGELMKQKDGKMIKNVKQTAVINILKTCIL